MQSLSKRLTFGILALALFTAGCQDATMGSGSMAPTIPPGTKVTIDYTAFSMDGPKRWEVIAFRPLDVPDQVWIARVVGLPGETISFDTNGVAVNSVPAVLPGNLTNVTYVRPDAKLESQSDIKFPYTVPADHYFVLGDNSSNSFDSRYWGGLPSSNVVGRVKGF